MGPIRTSKSRKKALQPNPVTLFTPPLSQSQPSDWWLHFSKRFHGTLLESDDSQSFESMFKISMKTFDYICSIVSEKMSAKSSNLMDLNGNPLSLYDQVAIALRRLGSGESLAVIGISLNLNQATVAQVTKRFIDALTEQGLHHLHWPSTEAEMLGVKRKFENLGGLPNCCGAIDTTHILMCLSAVDRSTNAWCDRQNNQTMTVQAVADADMRFRDVTVGWPGSLTDEGILKRSAFFELCEEGKILNGTKRELSQGNEVGEYIVGDSSFPLLPWLLTPYRGKTLCDSEVKLNKMVLKTRIVGQRALAKLKQNWKIIEGVMWRPDKHILPKIILGVCILHNIVIDMKDEVQEKMEFWDVHDVGYRQEVCDSDDDENGLVLREKINLYLSKRSTP